MDGEGENNTQKCWGKKMNVGEERENVGLKLNVQKTKIMAS